MAHKTTCKIVTLIFVLIIQLANLIHFNYFDCINSTNDLNTNNQNKINACIIVLVRNKDLNNLIRLIKQVDLAFNMKFNYPYVIFNDEEFDDKFKNNLQENTNSKIELASIDKQFWSLPHWIDKKKLNESIKKFGKNVNYRHMCRFYSGFFFRHAITLKYDYFMRLDSDSAMFEIHELEDPFEKLIYDGIGYGFLLANEQPLLTMPTLWNTVKQWANASNIIFNSSKSNGLSLITDDNGKTLNKDLCIFYNNFEMGDFSFFRSQAYLDYFDYLDKTGGFYYERWVKF